jgi:predicted transcriptional regulator
VTIAKEEVIQLLDQLPEPIEIEELIYRLYMREKLAAAEADIAAGRTVSAEEVRAEAASWRK